MNFPLGKYVVVGSGQLAARNLRPAKDLDIIVTDDFWDNLLESGLYKLIDKHDKPFLVEPNTEELEIMKELNWNIYQTSITEIIAGADIIKGFPFLNISDTIKIKKIYGREKDFNDIKLLEDFQKKRLINYHRLFCRW